MENENKNLWYGYLHTNGSIQVKRYFDIQDITEAQGSPFVEQVFEPFYAIDREDAIEIIKSKL